MKHKVGDKVKIIANTSGHQFKIGEETVITQVCDYFQDVRHHHYGAKDTAGKTWFFYESETESATVVTSDKYSFYMKIYNKTTDEFVEVNASNATENDILNLIAAVRIP